jgi:hypothetical protein
MMDNMRTLVRPLHRHLLKFIEDLWGYTLSNMYTVTTGLYLIDLINFYWLEKAFDSH